MSASFLDLYAQTTGRWPMILNALGISIRADSRHGPCPACGGKDRFRFDDKERRGTWFCNQCVPHAGDGLDLVQKVLRCDFSTAAERVAAVVGPASHPAKNPSKPVSISGNGKAPRISGDIPSGELGKTLFQYEDQTGQPVIYVQRIENPDGGKRFVQWGSSEDGLRWQSNLDHAPKPRPLYGLSSILSTPSETVIFHEGEKAVEAAISAGLPGVHTTTLAGANSPHLSDFNPLAGRDVVVCPDNDTAGQRYAQDVAALASKAGATSAGILTLPNLPMKGDVVEWLEAGGTPDGFEALLATAQEGKSLHETMPSKKNLADAVVPYEDLLRIELPERKAHLAWLREGSLVMTFGTRGVGKTMFQLGLTAGLVTGTKFLNWDIATPVGVLYVDGEMSLDELRTRITAFLPNTPKAPLNFLTAEVVYARLQQDLKLSHPEIQDQVTAILDNAPDIRVVILDNISSLFTGLDEDKKSAWEPVASWLLKLRHRGLAVVLVHHAGKGGNQRGTSGREDALDAVIQLNSPAGYDPREGCRFELRFTKSRSVRGDDVAPLEIRLIEGPRGSRLDCTPLEVSKEDQAAQLLADGITSPADLAEALGVARSYAYKLLKKVKTREASGGAR